MKKFAKLSVVLPLCATVFAFGCTTTIVPPPEDDNPPKVNYTVDLNQMTENSDPKSSAYRVSSVQKQENHPLADKTIYWLGSSVTYGSASNGEGVGEYLAAMTGCISKKDAVSGTTLFDDGGSGDSGAKSYTRRMLNSTVFTITESVDAFICQISTNDAINNRLSKRGIITADDVTNMDDFNRGTTLGAVEYIIAYVENVWNCPVYFYSGSYFGDSGARSNANPSGTNYAMLVNQVKQICEKWNKIDGYEVGVIDMYNDADFNAAVTDEYYDWCTSDAIHPFNAGYLHWWTPYFENYLINHL